MQKPINRCLDDKRMDHIDHALGRPLDPFGETYRNYFATDGALASEMAISPFWTDGGNKYGPRIMRYFHVTDEGKRALADYLQSTGDKHRAFVVKFDEFSRVVVATSRSRAKYSYFLDVSDCWSGLSFKEFCQRATIVNAQTPR